MPGRVAAPRRLRRRLTVAFVLVAGISATALAAGSFLVVRQARLNDSVSRAEQQAELNLRFAARTPERSGSEDVTSLLSGFGRSAFDTVALKGDATLGTSTSTLGASDVPDDLREQVAAGNLAYERITAAGTPYLVMGGRIPERTVDLYFFFSEARLQRDLRQLGTILLIGLAAVIVVAGLVGSLLARGTLAPVAAASQAARSLAEGLLATRLPADRGGKADEFGAWAASFNQMADALQAKIIALSEAQARERRFTSDVSHELRTPLAALVSEASLLREHLDAMPEEARRPAELLVADVARLRRLVEELMEISRLDAGGGDLRVESVDVGSLVAGSVRARGWESRVRLETDGLVLPTDRRRLDRVVTNLVGNALEHGGRDVSVRVGRDALGAFLEVQDRGRGISPEHLAHLFDRFYKADPSRSGPGSGLGLAIALENARLLGGDIDVWSELGEGTRFTLRLPLASPAGPGDTDWSGEPVTEPLRPSERHVAGDPDARPRSRERRDSP
jgi:two-component system, OmpR family, sensor histidine kinase MtrB